MTALAELVSGRRAKLGLSLRQAAEKSAGRVSPSTLHAIEIGQRTRLDETTILGLADALNVPATRIRTAAKIPAEHGPFVLPDEAARLTQRERKLVLELVRVLLAAKERP